METDQQKKEKHQVARQWKRSWEAGLHGTIIFVVDAELPFGSLPLSWIKIKHVFHDSVLQAPVLTISHRYFETVWGLWLLRGPASLYPEWQLWTSTVPPHPRQLPSLPYSCSHTGPRDKKRGSCAVPDLQQLLMVSAIRGAQRLLTIHLAQRLAPPREFTSGHKTDQSQISSIVPPRLHLPLKHTKRPWLRCLSTITQRRNAHTHTYTCHSVDLSIILHSECGRWGGGRGDDRFKNTPEQYWVLGFLCAGSMQSHLKIGQKH